MENLTPRQKRFADEYLKSGNATEASKLAGYSPKYAGENAAKLLKNTNIQNYIKQKNDELNRENIADIEEIKSFWTYAMRSSSNDMKDRLKASEHLARTEGAFIEQNILKFESKSINETVKELDELFRDLK